MIQADRIDALGYLLGRARAAMVAALDAKLKRDSDLTFSESSFGQYTVLATIEFADEAICASDLCRAISYDAGAMTRMLDRLAVKDWIQRERSGQDRRIIQVTITDRGRRDLAQMRRVVIRVLNRLLRGFSRSEARQFESLLGRMLSRHDSPQRDLAN